MPVIIIMKLLNVTVDKFGHSSRFNYKSISVI